MEGTIRDILSEIQPIVKKLVKGDIVLPTWSPPEGSVNEDTAEHLASLKIPSLKGKPNLLLHDLGRFTRDKQLERRLKNIFMSNNHTCVSSLPTHSPRSCQNSVKVSSQHFGFR